METGECACVIANDYTGMLADFLLTTVPCRALPGSIATDGKKHIEQCVGILLDPWLQMDELCGRKQID
jgi:hypothetical protein